MHLQITPERNKGESIIEKKIIIVDSIMGSGKTEAVIRMVNENPDTSYIYVVTLLDQVDRIIRSTHGRFKQPENYGDGKLGGLHRLLTHGADIVTTHALFLRATPETMELIHQGNYVLILDEALDVFQEYNSIVKEWDGKTITKEGVDWLKRAGHISVDPETCVVTWSGETADNFQFSEIIRLANNGTLRCIDNAFFWEFPPEVLHSFSQIYVLTYQFEGTVFDSYMRMYDLEYTLLSARKGEAGNFELCDYNDGTEIKSQLVPLLNIYEGDLNRIGRKHNAFSVAWLSDCKGEQLAKIKNAMRSYRHHTKAASPSILWTTSMKNDFHQKLEAVRGFKHTRQLSKEDHNLPEKEFRRLRCFLFCSAKATNDFAERTTLLYLLNRYASPETKKYFALRGFPIDEDIFATNEMVQWIWRSAIRNGQRINLFIPSSRMRGLLYRWLGISAPSNIPRTKRVLRES